LSSRFHLNLKSITMKPLVSVAAPLVIMSLLSIPCVWGQGAEDLRAKRAALVAQLRHQESLVRSAECEFECRRHPTRPEMIRRLRQFAGKDEKIFQRYLLTEEMARQRSYTVHWWRKGVKERLETRQATAPADRPPVIKAFDGNVVRTVGQQAGSSKASITTTEKAHWNSAQRTHPYAFLFEYLDHPFSKLVEKGKDFEYSTVQADGKTLERVRIADPENPAALSFVLFFDSDRRLVERQMWRLRRAEKVKYIRERMVFENYTAYPEASGDTIWLPHKVHHHYYIEPLPDGSPIEWTWETITIHKIAFNVEIPDALFVPTLPPETQVRDDISGQGNIPVGTVSEKLWLDPPVDRPWWRRWWVWCLAPLPALLGFWVVRWRSKAGRRSNPKSPTP
jgi:hypothetical protein